MKKFACQFFEQTSTPSPLIIFAFAHLTVDSNVLHRSYKRPRLRNHGLAAVYAIVFWIGHWPPTTLLVFLCQLFILFVFRSIVGLILATILFASYVVMGW
jgi:hypothetical protein